jgi:crotonobetainyl-CoA:carnitine CoA-transferase CaiB-like acyl-CoA transferase
MHGDPQTIARGMVTTTHHDRLGPVETIGPPVKLSATPAAVNRAAPDHGEHTAEVLGEIGYTAAEIDVLAATGAVLIGGSG